MPPSRAPLPPKVDVWLVAGIKAPRGASADEVVHALGAAGLIQGDGRAEGKAQEQEDGEREAKPYVAFPLLPRPIPSPVSGGHK